MRHSTQTVNIVIDKNNCCIFSRVYHRCHPSKSMVPLGAIHPHLVRLIPCFLCMSSNDQNSSIRKVAQARIPMETPGWLRLLDFLCVSNYHTGPLASVYVKSPYCFSKPFKIVQKSAVKFFKISESVGVQQLFDKRIITHF